MSAWSAAISARFSKKILTVGASMMVMAIMTTSSASMRPEKALAGTGCSPAGAAPCPEAVPDEAPDAVAVPFPAGFGLAAFCRAADGAPGGVAADGVAAGGPVPAWLAWWPGVREFGAALPAWSCWVPRELPKSAWMTSPPSPVSGDFGAAGVARGTLGRRVAMSLL